MTASPDTRSLEAAVADAIQEAMAEADDAYWYRLKIDKSGYEVFYSDPEQRQYCGEGTRLVNRKHREAARRYTDRLRALFIAKAAIGATEGVA